MSRSTPGATRLVAALLAFVAVALSGAPAGAQSDDDERATGGTIVLASQTPWVVPGGELVLRLRIAGVDASDRATLGVTVHSRVRSRSQFRLTFEGDRLGGALRTTTARLDELAADEAGAVTVRLAPADVNVTRAGVYPVAVTLRGRSGVLDRLVTHLVFLPPPLEGPPLNVAWVVPVHAPPALRANGTTVLPRRDLDALADALAAAPYASVPVTLLPTPETLLSLSQDREEGGGVVELLRTATRGRQVLGSPYVPLDVSAMVDAGLEDETSAQLADGLDVVEELLGVRPDARTWVADEHLDAAGLAQLRALQVDQVVLPEAAMEPVDLRLTLAAPFTVETRPGRRLTAAAAEPGLASYFGSNDGDPVLAAHRFLSDLAVLWFDAPRETRGIVVVTPRTWNPDRRFLDVALDGLARSPVVSAVTLDGLFANVEPALVDDDEPLVRTLDPEPSAARLPASSIRDARRRLEAFTSTLVEGSRLAARLERPLLVSQSADLRTTAQRRAYLDSLHRSIDEELAQVQVPRARSVTLTARRGEIPITLLNRTEHPMRVFLRVRSDTLEFPESGSRQAVVRGPLELPPGNTTVRFEVRARTSGAFPLEFSMESPEGGLVLASARVTVRSTAASGVGLALSIGAGAFLFVWWGRHLVRGRRARRLVPA